MQEFRVVDTNATYRHSTERMEPKEIHLNLSPTSLLFRSDGHQYEMAIWMGLPAFDPMVLKFDESMLVEIAQNILRHLCPTSEDRIIELLEKIADRAD